MAKRPLYINGRFLQKPVTGTERFAREIVWAMDELLAEQTDHPDVTIISPPGTPAPEGLKITGFEICGARQGHAWEQWELYCAARDGILLSLTNSGSVLHPRQMVVIHDGAPYRMPGDFSFAYRTFHRILGCLLAWRSRVATVSEFSRGDLAAVLGISAEAIPVIYNGHEHILRCAPDEGIIEKLELKERPYFLFVGSPVPRKNLDMAIRAFHALEREDAAFVIVGALNAKVFGKRAQMQAQNVILPGRLTDEEIVALYRHAQALVFPSLYEGFGIPPLEAMVQGCPVLASDIPPMREVCGDSALYFDSRDPAQCARHMQKFLDNPSAREDLIRKGAARYPAFSWKTSAGKILDELMDMG
ncbi:MAG: glycosyltransferase family 4 protein, partial [Alphaproteobacteria bacterium]|nr:glycosyltransferase family 4 protein [Alphaproteobacteria bacterium]